MKVYLYSRVSTDKQTLAQQEKTAYDWLNSHHLSVSEVISDENVSGNVSYKERNLGKILIPKLKPNDILIVSEISRLGRSMYDLNVLINDSLKPRKVRLIIASMGIDLNCNELKAMDQLILNNFGFAAQVEIELNHDRTSQAMKVRQKQLEERGYFINKKGEKCTGFGAAAENYKRNEANQAEGRLKYARTRTLKTIQSEDFKCFCRILKRSYEVLQAPSDSLQAPSDLFMLSFCGCKAIVTKNTTKEVLIKVLEQMRNAKADNPTLFTNYKLDDSPQQLATIRAKISNTFRTIDAYIINNK